MLHHDEIGVIGAKSDSHALTPGKWGASISVYFVTFMVRLDRSYASAWSNRHRWIKSRFTWSITGDPTRSYSRYGMVNPAYMNQELLYTAERRKITYFGLDLPFLCVLVKPALSHGKIGVEEPNSDPHGRIPAKLNFRSRWRMFCTFLVCLGQPYAITGCNRRQLAKIAIHMAEHL